VCVEFILDLAARVGVFEDRLGRLEEQARRDPRTSSAPPSQDPPKTRQQRRAEARAKAKELSARESAKRNAGGQPGIVTLTARNRISRRGIAELAGELFGARLSTGSVDAICQHASTALSVAHSELRDWILAQDAVHVDETGWRTAGDSRALWTAATQGASIFEIAEHCNREQFNELIGDYAGIVVSDRWDGYEHLDPDRRQVCWSHLRRDFRRHSEGLAEQKTFGEQGLELTRRVFAAWRAYQHDHHDRSRLNTQIAPIQTKLRQLLEHASPKSQRTRWHRAVRQQPPQDLAGALDLRHRRWRRTDQQPRRARAPRTRDPPKTLARNPHQQRRAIRRTRPLRRSDLPPATPLPVRVPHRTDHRPHARRPAPRTHLSPGTERSPIESRFACVIPLEWSQRGWNPWPPACKSSAAAENDRRRKATVPVGFWT
jgi:Transposase IS66 family